jgi:phosphatidylserine/phosphatidylglycerophosphate/cardiolipin synthase-like enzyme
MCSETQGSEVLLLESLHAKLYLLQAADLQVAVLGSPNFTPSGDDGNRELAIEVRSIKETDPSALLVRDLFLFARELMADTDTHFLKRFGDHTSRILATDSLRGVTQ